MKRLAFLFLFILLSSYLFAQNGRIIFLRGTVGKYKTEMTLRVYGSGEVTGFYQYEGKQAWLRLSGRNSDGKNLVLQEFPDAYTGRKSGDNHPTTGTFTGLLDKENFTGKWSSPDGNSILDFAMRVECGDEGICFTQQKVVADTTVYIEGFHENGIQISAQMNWLRSNSGNKKLDYALDTFIFNRTYYPDMFENYKPVFPDYQAMADSLVIKNINYDSRMEWLAGCDVLWNGHGILCLESGHWEYTGGAHGNGYTEYNCFDLHSGKLLTTDDIFKKGYEEPLRLKAVQHLDRDPDFIERDSLELNGNFFLTPEGIGFFYNSYEISSYTSGTPVAFIPWKELDQWIDPEGPMAWVKK